MILYHYTNEAGYRAILQSRRLSPSLKANNPKDARYGDGQYLSDIIPGTKRGSQLSYLFRKVEVFRNGQYGFASRLASQSPTVLSSAPLPPLSELSNSPEFSARKGIRRTKGGIPPIRYDAVRSALARVAHYCRQRKASVHMPRIGCGLAGGRWEEMEPILLETLVEQGIPVTVYDLAPESKAPRRKR